MGNDVDALQADATLVYERHTSTDPGQSTVSVCLVLLSIIWKTSRCSRSRLISDSSYAQKRTHSISCMATGFRWLKADRKQPQPVFGWTLEEVFGAVSLESTEKYAWLKNPLPWCSILAEHSEITRLCHCVPVVLGFELGCSHLLWMQMWPMSHPSQKCES